MNVLVTGGAGYIGCRLVPALLDAGHTVRVLDKLQFGDEGLAPCRDRIALLPVDVQTVEAQQLDGIDAIVHLAGLSNDPTAEYNPKANQATNLDATLRLATLAKKHGIRRFVFASSCSIYYTTEPTDDVCDEQTTVDPQAPYSRSKRQAEIGLMKLVDDRFCAVALRKGTVYGQSPRMRYDLVVNTFTRDAYAKRRLALHAGGRMWRPMLHIDDAVQAYLAALSAPEEHVRGQIFNVVGDNCRVLHLAHQVRGALERRKGIRLDLDIQDVGVSRSYKVNGDKFQREVDFEPQHDIEMAASEMWDELEKGVDLDNPIYYNIRWLELLCDMERRLEVMGGHPF